MIGGRRRSGQQRMRWFNSITDSMDMSLSKLSVIGKNKEVWQKRSPWSDKESDMTERITHTHTHTHTHTQRKRKRRAFRPVESLSAGT